MSSDNPIMARSPHLGRVLLRQHMWLLAMLLVTAALGGSWIAVWQTASEEALRINDMMREAQQLYRDVYRQAQEAIIASRTEDQLSVSQYWEHAYDMDARFERVEQRLRESDEAYAIEGMRNAYAMMQTQINVLLYRREHENPNQVIDAAVEKWITGAFSDAYSSLNGVLHRRQQVVAARLQRWNRMAALLLPLPLIAAILLVLFAHRHLKRVFSQPMQSLSASATEISRGHLDHRVAEIGVAETRALAAAINQMAADLGQAREQLLEQERQASLGRLVPMVAHNIRNPLASIRAVAQASQPDDEPAEQEETRQAIIATVDRLERWTASLLDYLHPFTPHPTPLDTQVLTATLAEVGRHQAVACKVTLSVRAAPGLTVLADRSLLEQALHGLLINAIEASPPESTVRIQTERSADRVCIHIDDQGPGIPFIPDQSNTGPGPTTKTHGTGLGIPFALRICQAHGGRLGFSRSPLGGTRATVELLIATQAGGGE